MIASSNTALNQHLQLHRVTKFSTEAKGADKCKESSIDGDRAQFHANEAFVSDVHNG